MGQAFWHSLTEVHRKWVIQQKGLEVPKNLIQTYEQSTKPTFSRWNSELLCSVLCSLVGWGQCAIREFYLLPVHSSPSSLDQLKCHLCEWLTPALGSFVTRYDIPDLELTIITYVAVCPVWLPISWEQGLHLLQLGVLKAGHNPDRSWILNKGLWCSKLVPVLPTTTWLGVFVQVT